MEDLKNKSISQIASIILKDWRKPYFGAVPYLEAMSQIDSVSDQYMFEDGKTQVIYFLSNATTWKGDVARAVKAELKRRIK